MHNNQTKIHLRIKQKLNQQTAYVVLYQSRFRCLPSTDTSLNLLIWLKIGEEKASVVIFDKRHLKEYKYQLSNDILTRFQYSIPMSAWPYVARCLDLNFLTGLSLSLCWLLPRTAYTRNLVLFLRIEIISPYLYFARFLDEVCSLIFNNYTSLLETNNRTRCWMILGFTEKITYISTIFI